MVEFLFAYDRGASMGALQRIQSQPLMRGLRALGRSSKSVWVGDNEPLEDAAVVLFHYFDKAAPIFALRQRVLNKSTLLCLASDIHWLDKYVDHARYVHGFIAPTPLHASVLEPIVSQPVYFVPEAIDLIALPLLGNPETPLANNEAMWFGYPRSFSQSFDVIVQQIFRQDPEFSPRITAVTSTTINSPLVRATLPFDERTFYEISSQFSHALLGHYPFDLKINTFIKSPNKLITALVRGLVPIASATPSYTDLANSYGIAPVLYRTAHDLAAQLNRMDHKAQSADLKLPYVRRALLDDFSDVAVARRFLAATGL